MANRRTPSTRRFVGRASELERLAELQESGAGGIVVVGPAGSGKTRLAMQHAHRMGSRKSDGGYAFCELSMARSAADLCLELSRVLGVPLRGDSDAASRIGHALNERGPILLTFDNCEGLDADAERVVGQWQAAAPEATLLLTSQRRLDLESCVTFELKPLPTPPPGISDAPALRENPAVKLFVSCVRAGSDGYHLTDTSGPVVAEIVRKLDGIPLAIELCAAGVVPEREADVLASLNEPRPAFMVLETSEHRHDTLANALRWSWSLLPDWARSAMEQLSVFAGGFTFDAVSEVVQLHQYPDAPSPQPSSVALLSYLFDRCMVKPIESTGRRSTERRYGMLNCIRQYAGARLECTSDADQVRARHARFLVKLAERAQGNDRAEQHRAVIFDELDNFTEAHRWALTSNPIDRSLALSLVLPLQGLFMVHGPAYRFAQLVEQTISEEVPPQLQASAYAAKASVESQLGEFASAAANHQRALTLFESVGEYRRARRVRVEYALAVGLSGDFREAEKQLDLVDADQSAEPDAELERRRQYAWGHVYLRTGQLAASGRHFERALQLSRIAGKSRDVGAILCNLATHLNELGRLPEARRRYSEAIDVLEAAGDRRARAVAESKLANIDRECGDFDAARARLQSAISIQRKLGDRNWEAITEGLFGHLALEEGRFEQALHRYRIATMNLPESYRRWAGLYCGGMALAHAFLGQAAEARSHLEIARATAEQIGIPPDTQACDLFDTTVDVILARHEQVNQPDAYTAAVARAEQTLRSLGEETADLIPVEVRAPQRVLRRVLAGDLKPAADLPRQELHVGAGATWFSIGAGGRTDISRRHVLRRLFSGLVSARRVAPGTGVSIDKLTTITWPRTRLNPEAASARVYVAVRTLRTLGLHDILKRQDDGYLLDPTVPLREKVETNNGPFDSNHVDA